MNAITILLIALLKILQLIKCSRLVDMSSFPGIITIFNAILLVSLGLTTISGKSPDTNIQDHVRVLQDNLERQLRQRHGHIQPISDSDANYEDDEKRITPILDRDRLKQDDRFRLKRLKTTTTPEPPAPPPSIDRPKPIERTGKPVSKSLDIFYRKSFDGDHNTPIPWLHCSELISPYLQGAKKEMTKPGTVGVDSHVVLRLVQLLSMNTTGSSADEIYSILYQISKLKIRLWSWSIPAMKLLFNVIIKDTQEQAHTYKRINRGVKELFTQWNLDNSNLTRLLMQSRVFRPPCIYHKHTGSSRLARGSTITRPTTTPDGDDSGPDCHNRAHDHG